MDVARTRSNQEVVTTDYFASLSDTDRDNLRDSLECPECGADAYFAQASRTGRRASFGARPHRNECSLATTDHAISTTPPPLRREYRINSESDTTGDLRDHSGVRGSTTPSHHDSVSTLRLGTLLHRLLSDDAFGLSDALLRLPGEPGRPIRDACVHVYATENDHINETRIYWGVIRYPRAKDNGGAWLNTRRRAPTLVLSAQQLRRILDRHHLDDLEDLSGSAFAIHAPLRQSSDGQTYLFARSIKWLSLRPFGSPGTTTESESETDNTPRT